MTIKMEKIIVHDHLDEMKTVSADRSVEMMQMKTINMISTDRSIARGERDKEKDEDDKLAMIH